jgi:hypothetical protein
MLVWNILLQRWQIDLNPGLKTVPAIAAMPGISLHLAGS